MMTKTLYSESTRVPWKRKSSSETPMYLPRTKKSSATRNSKLLCWRNLRCGLSTSVSTCDSNKEHVTSWTVGMCSNGNGSKMKQARIIGLFVVDLHWEVSRTKMQTGLRLMPALQVEPHKGYLPVKRQTIRTGISLPLMLTRLSCKELLTRNLKC